ncbi:hypothetical protein TNCV_2501511 [Trichonephila clavipes]|nr:hypothetical protein TNCV_2501511 [Trichonephila clavipes]
MVDIDILMEIWKNRVKKIDFVLKWLSRVGSEVVPTKGSGDSRRVAIMDFGAPLTIGEAYLKIIMSSFLGFCEWNTRNRWRDGQVCPDVDKELWRFGPDDSGVFGGLCANKKKEEVKRDFGDLRIRKSEGRVVNTPLVFKEVSFSGDERRPEKKKERRGDPKGEVEGKGTRESGRENGRKEEKRARKREGLVG